MTRSYDIFKSATQIVKGERRALAKAITLIESTHANDKKYAELLVKELRPHTGNSIRIGISGVPGVGKSTFIETFGLQLIKKGHRVAVLAIDPSSPKTGGSILGDKTRMERLSKNQNAFIRPSPAKGTLGGVASQTRQTILAAEASGFDIIIVETVGVGQSETKVSMLCDIFILMIVPAGGDELQGLKKGIIELSDLIVINKADGELSSIAERTRADYQNALNILTSKNNPYPKNVMKCSALFNSGVSDIITAVIDFCEEKKKTGDFELRRSIQSVTSMWDIFYETLNQKLVSNKKIRATIKELEEKVQNNKIPPAEAAKSILEHFLG